MKEIIEIIEKLRSLSGNAQIDELKKHKDNLLLKEVLQYTYDTDKKYGIKEDKYNKIEYFKGEIKLNDLDIWNGLKKELDRLSEQKSAKDKDILAIKTLIENSKYADLLRCVVLKDLRLGLNVKTLNKVWEDFCFRFPYMGARPFSMDNVKKIKMPCLAQLKADGMFCNAIVDPINKKVEYKSRQGKDINIYGSLENDLLKIKANGKFVLNGELLCLDENYKPLPREISNGIIRRDNKTQEELNSIVLLCWDCIPYEHFIKGIWEVPYEERLDLLCQMSDMAGYKLRAIDTYTIEDIDGAMSLFNDLYSKGEEGIILKENDIIWKDGKPKGQVKIKNESECDLKAIGFEEGSGAYSGMCGSIICISEDKKLQVNVKPRTPQQASDVWQNQDKYMNQILTVKYNARIKDKNKEVESLFLPVFVEWRIGEKDVADNIEDIK